MVFKRASRDKYVGDPKARINPATNKPFQLGEWFYKNDGKRMTLRSVTESTTITKGIHAGEYLYRFEQNSHVDDIELFKHNAKLLKEMKVEPKFHENPMTNKKWQKGDKHRLGYIFEKYDTECVTNDGFAYGQFRTYPEEILSYLPRRLTRFNERNLKKFGKESNLDIKYLLWIFTMDMICPVTKRKMHIGNPRDQDMLSLDRIDNNKGYEIGNVIYVSMGVNTIKKDSDYDLMKKTVEFYESKMSTRDK